MQIIQKKLINLSKIEQILTQRKIRQVKLTIPITDHLLKKLGLKEKPKNWASFLPQVCGPVSRYNAEGGYIIHKDLPKEPRIINTVDWHWTDWNGTHYSRLVDIKKDCYPRDIVQPPAIELVINNDEFEIPNINVENSLMLKHCINLCLELAGSCEVLKEDGSSILPNIKRVNWEILPPGQYPFQKIREFIHKRTQEKIKIPFDVFRFDYLESKKPIEIWRGLGGFSNYFVYIYPHNLIIIDSLKYANATYVVDQNWEEISQKTKKEILDNHLHKQRIIHTKSWEKQISKLFTMAS